MSASGDDEEFWFCLKHHTVERRDGCRSADRHGPYATEAEAARALERVQERNEAWKAQDDDWDETGPAGEDRG